MRALAHSAINWAINMAPYKHELTKIIKMQVLLCEPTCKIIIQYSKKVAKHSFSKVNISKKWIAFKRQYLIFPLLAQVRVTGLGQPLQMVTRLTLRQSLCRMELFSLVRLGDTTFLRKDYFPVGEHRVCCNI